MVADFRPSVKVDFKRMGKIVPNLDEDNNARKNLDNLSTNQQKSSLSTSRFGFCCHQTRYVMLFIVLLCLTFIWSNVLTYNFTIVCITDSERERFVITINIYYSFAILKTATQIDLRRFYELL